MTPRILFFLLLAASSALPARAAIVPIFEADAPILSMDARDHDQAVRNAFRRVLVKASGDPSIAALPEVDAMLGGIDTMVIGEESRQVVVTDAVGQPEVRQMLRVRFDADAIRRSLTSLGRPIWPEQRPSMMVWLVVDDGTRKQIASSTQIQALGALTQRAEDRGLIVQLPTMDGVDQGRVDAVTLWDAPLKVVVGASGRYGTSTSLLIRLRRSGSEWSARYALIQGSQYEEWNAVDTTSAPLLSLGVDGAADRLARRHAFDSSEPSIGAMSLWITGIHTGTDYARALAYLRRLDVIRQVDVVGADGDKAWVTMDVAAGPKRFRQLLKYDQRMNLVDVPVAEGQPAAYALELLP